MNSPLQVLIVEDSENDALLLEIALRRVGYDLHYHRVETPAQLKAALERQSWHLVIADYVMPQFNGLAALAMVKEMGLDLPFIIVSGHITDDTAVAAMKAGAHDYVMKDNLARLGPAVEREMRDAEVRRARAQADHKLKVERRKAEETLRRAYGELEVRVQQRTADLKLANEKLQAAITERRRLEHELLEITEKERRRIGLDLHDDLGQRLSGIALMTKGLELRLAKEGKAAAQDAARIHGLVEQAMNHASDLAHDLATLNVKDDDLPCALDDLAARARELFGISCRFRADGDTPALPIGTGMQLCKIAQEAVTNAIKHGKAKVVGINLANGYDKLMLSVQNDGLPFPDLRSGSTGMGLRIMNYRANLIGATLNIRGLEQGTLLTCAVALEGRHLSPQPQPA